MGDGGGAVPAIVGHGLGGFGDEGHGVVEPLDVGEDFGGGEGETPGDRSLHVVFVEFVAELNEPRRGGPLEHPDGHRLGWGVGGLAGPAHAQDSGAQSS